ncbi:uncharacterized protein LOC111518724 isoform X1 [Drosophila willistoni]|uniref:uncharacterized protein LOC111518724 isoform X1 n=1 Tax=Drosophila willistoni TaxID=7260 RepID=UPI001F0832B5|nr:uncharacterized protein LOC111518724 isoform X1 [Drosophila willistoni]XP_046865610.1 uncharacterized protein LOC111518724 isoform X1 [Drosophila willistoni]
MAAIFFANVGNSIANDRQQNLVKNPRSNQNFASPPDLIELKKEFQKFCVKRKKIKPRTSKNSAGPTQTESSLEADKQDDIEKSQKHFKIPKRYHSDGHVKKVEEHLKTLSKSLPKLNTSTKKKASKNADKSKGKTQEQRSISASQPIYSKNSIKFKKKSESSRNTSAQRFADFYKTHELNTSSTSDSDFISESIASGNKAIHKTTNYKQLRKTQSELPKEVSKSIRKLKKHSEVPISVETGKRYKRARKLKWDSTKTNIQENTETTQKGRESELNKRIPFKSEPTWKDQLKSYAKLLTELEQEKVIKGHERKSKSLPQVNAKYEHLESLLKNRKSKQKQRKTELKKVFDISSIPLQLGKKSVDDYSSEQDYEEDASVPIRSMPNLRDASVQPKREKVEIIEESKAFPMIFTPLPKPFAGSYEPKQKRSKKALMESTMRFNWKKPPWKLATKKRLTHDSNSSISMARYAKDLSHRRPTELSAATISSIFSRATTSYYSDSGIPTIRSSKNNSTIWAINEIDPSLAAVQYFKPIKAKLPDKDLTQPKPMQVKRRKSSKKTTMSNESINSEQSTEPALKPIKSNKSISSDIFRLGPSSISFDSQILWRDHMFSAINLDEFRCVHGTDCDGVYNSWPKIWPKPQKKSQGKKRVKRPSTKVLNPRYSARLLRLSMRKTVSCQTEQRSPNELCLKCDPIKLIETKGPRQLNYNSNHALRHHAKRRLKLRHRRRTKSCQTDEMPVDDNCCQTWPCFRHKEPDQPYMLEMRREMKRLELRNYYRLKLQKRSNSSLNPLELMRTQLQMCQKILCQCDQMVEQKKLNLEPHSGCGL